MAKTHYLNLELTTDDQTLFEVWRNIINGQGAGTTESPYSNAQLIDNAVGSLQENKQDKITEENKLSYSLISGVPEFVTKTVNNLENYYLKTETYTKSEVDTKIAQIETLKIKKVAVLPPVSEADKQTIYLVPAETEEEQNIYDEYIVIDNAWEKIGSTKIDLDNYYTKEQTDDAIAEHHDTTKQNVISDLETIRSGAALGATALQEVPDTYRTSAAQDVIDASLAEDIANVAADIETKQDIIEDLNHIREGAALGSTAVQPNDLTWEKGTGLNSVQSKGTNCVAQGDYSVAEGHTSKTVKDPDHELSGQSAHAEGEQTTAQGFASHSEGGRTFAIADHSHAEGYNTTTGGADSHAEGNNTVTNNWAEHAEGRYNVSHKNSDNNNDPLNTQSSIGIGTAPGTVEFENNKNAVEVMQNGDVYIIGIGDYEGKDLDDAETLQEVVNSKSTVTVSNTGTSSDEVKYITVNGVEKKITGTNVEANPEDMPVDTLTKLSVNNVVYSISDVTREEFNRLMEYVGILYEFHDLALPNALDLNDNKITLKAKDNNTEIPIVYKFE